MKGRETLDEKTVRQMAADLNKIRRVVAREDLGCVYYALLISMLPALLYGAYLALKSAGWWF